jgi:soluble lytic murein transglycosylase-like protein
MQQHQTNPFEFFPIKRGVARPVRLVGLLLAAMTLSFANAIYAAEAPLTTDAPSVGASFSTGAAPNDDNTPALVEIATIVSRQFRVTRAESTTIARAVLDAANRFAMSPALLLGVIATESGFNRCAVSPAGARGLMQVLPSAHPGMVSGGKDLSDPVVNVAIGSSILREYLDDSGGDLASALSRYSGGGKGYARRVALHMQQFSRFSPIEKPSNLRLQLQESAQ